VNKTSIYLPADLDHALERLAAAHGISKAEAIRRAVATAVADAPQPRITAIGVLRGGAPDISVDVDRYLDETGFGEE
jgi:hypothetical protein